MVRTFLQPCFFHQLRSPLASLCLLSVSCRLGFICFIFSFIHGAGNGNRTRTMLSHHGILSPGRLPIPPFRHLVAVSPAVTVLLNVLTGSPIPFVSTLSCRVHSTHVLDIWLIVRENLLISWLIGAPSQTWTADSMIKNHVLYRLS